MMCKGHHARSCPCGGDRTLRHHASRNLTGDLAQEAGKNPELEKAGLLKPDPELPGSNLRRPADVYLPSWKHGRPAALDLAITSPQRRDIIVASSATQGATAAAYEQFKRAHLDTEQDCISQGISFIPMVAETCGGWGTSAMCTLKALAKLATQKFDANATDMDANPRLRVHLQKTCTAIRRANARAVLRRAQGHVGGAGGTDQRSAENVLDAASGCF